MSIRRKSALNATREAFDGYVLRRESSRRELPMGGACLNHDGLMWH
jgi:hypothetical protein